MSVKVGMVVNCLSLQLICSTPLVLTQSHCNVGHTWWEICMKETNVRIVSCINRSLWSDILVGLSL